MGVSKCAKISVGILALAFVATGAFGQSVDPGTQQRVQSVYSVLDGVDAVPMTAEELGSVTGQHIHFAIVVVGADEIVPRFPNASSNAGPISGPIHLVNFVENNLGKGNALEGSGPGYSGLCGAALKSPALWIPGQSPVTGMGAGC